MTQSTKLTLAVIIWGIVGLRLVFGESDSELFVYLLSGFLIFTILLAILGWRRWNSRAG